MNLVDLISTRVHLRKSGSRYVGPCPKCGGKDSSDRFSINPDKGFFHCFSCGFNGDEIKWYREMEGLNCPEAHERAGKTCDNTSCPAWDKCRLGNGNTGRIKTRPQKPQLKPPTPSEPAQYQAATAATPQQQWATQASALIQKAHAKLLADADHLEYLAGRGIPQEAVERGQLGYLPENRYPKRETWGLPTEFKADGKPKKMFIPGGILIPFYIEGQPHRIRIRRDNPRPGDPRYYWLQGSGDDVPVLGPQNARAVVVVESDLDAFMVRWQCRDLDVAVIPLGTCSAKPKRRAMHTLKGALSILLAHDFEPRVNEQTGVHENPGGQGARWWLQQFPHAKRWPVPAGKDPGDYYKDHNGDIRAWILAGLPPAFHVEKTDVQGSGTSPDQAEESLAPEDMGRIVRSKSGVLFGVVFKPEHKHAYAEYCGYNVLTSADIEYLAMLPEDERNQWLVANDTRRNLINADPADQEITLAAAREFNGRIKNIKLHTQEQSCQ